jgi:hypothetical protein
MNDAILAPQSLRRTLEEILYTDKLSRNAEWVERARTPVLFVDLPTNAVEGWQSPVTDSNTATWGATIAGGGANHVLAYFNGTAWTVAAI